MNGSLRFLAVAVLLAFVYHWLIDDNWSEMEEDNYNAEEDFMWQFSQTFQPQSSRQMGKGNKEKFKADFEEIQSREYFRVSFFNSSRPYNDYFT